MDPHTGHQILSWKFTLEWWLYIWWKYTDTQLISGVRGNSTTITIGGQWNNINLWNGWKGDAFVEGTLGSTELTYNGDTPIKTKIRTWQIMGAVTGSRDISENTRVRLGVGTNIAGQWIRQTDEKNGKFATIGPFGVPITGMSQLALSGGVDTRIWKANLSFDGNYVHHSAPNIQWLEAADFIPWKAGYSTTSINGGIAYPIWNGFITGTAGVTQDSLSRESRIWLGYSETDFAASLDRIKTKWTHTFGPTDSWVIRARVEQRVLGNRIGDTTPASLYAEITRKKWWGTTLAVWGKITW
jgi:hypothetical protein